jgi:RNA polymerase sigma factor (sigma-70 family)
MVSRSLHPPRSPASGQHPTANRSGQGASVTLDELRASRVAIEIDRVRRLLSVAAMMCRTRAIDRLRHNRSRGSTRTVALESVCELASDGLNPEELLSLFHHGSRVQGALKALSPQRLKLVGLAFFEGRSFPEMAKLTGLPLGTVKSHIRRALIELRRKLLLSDSPLT